MERLRIIFARELDHLLAGDLGAAEIGLRADQQILEIIMPRFRQEMVRSGVPRATMAVARRLIAPPGVETRSITI